MKSGFCACAITFQLASTTEQIQMSLPQIYRKYIKSTCQYLDAKKQASHLCKLQPVHHRKYMHCFTSGSNLHGSKCIASSHSSSTINPLSAELNPNCKSQLAELFCGVFKFCTLFLKNLNILRTKWDKFVKQKAFCGKGNRHCSVCLQML